MTTESKKDPRSSGSRVLVGAALAALVLGLAAVLAGALTSGSEAAYGALVGTVLVLAVFGLGAVVVDTVAGLMPAASLMVALLTYTLQVVAMALVLVGLSRSGLLDDTLDRAWLAGVVIAGTFGWLTTQVVLTTRLRIPAYEPVPAGVRGPDQGGDRA
jgi:ATP synthase protein I